MLSRKQQEEMVTEAFDPKRVTLFCGQHNYFGPVKGSPDLKPGKNCPKCWQIFFIHELSQCPPDKRGEKLDEIEEVLHHVVELVEQGKWDFEPYDHAKIEIGRE